MHADPHLLAGQTVKLNIKEPVGARYEPESPLFTELRAQEFDVEDWWDRVAGKSWMDCDGNPAALKYAMRSGFSKLPLDNEVVYGKVGSYGHLVHVSELVAL